MQDSSQPISDAVQAKQHPTPVESTLADYANELVLWVARHWLLLFNLAWGVYLFLPFAAPVLMHLGYTAPARVIYAIYSVFCHQLPDHSYFLFGSNPTPSLTTLEAGGLAPGLGLLDQRRFTGNDLLGYKVAMCQRDVAIYGSIFLAGLLFALLRHRMRPLSVKMYAILLIPLAVDGVTQMFGLRESNWWLRTVTGALFGAASVWLAYPYVEDAMQDVLDSEPNGPTMN